MTSQGLDDFTCDLEGQALGERDVDVSSARRRNVSECSQPRHREDALQDRLVALDIGCPVAALRVEVEKQSLAAAVVAINPHRGGAEGSCERQLALTAGGVVDAAVGADGANAYSGAPCEQVRRIRPLLVRRTGARVRGCRL
jgi:hypothetical protein